MALSVSSKVAVESQAAAWLRARDHSPQPDELAELKAENPSAYALVKALLTKRSLGLLDPKHPNPSFMPSSAAQSTSEDAVPQGAAAFESIAEESGEKPKAQVALAYPDAAVAPAHHDWLSWKPSQSAMDDDAMVKNVLGAVAELKAGKGASTNLRGQGHADSESDAGDALQWKDNAAAVAAAPAAPIAAEAKPKAAMSQENTYLKGIDFGLEAQPTPMQRSESSQDNSYLKGMNFGSSAHPAQLGLSTAKQTTDSHDFLAGFSWDDDKPARAAPPAAAPAVTEAPAASGAEASKAQGAKASSGSGGNALLAWLGGGAPAARAAPKPAKAAEAPQNSYMMDLQ